MKISPLIVALDVENLREVEKIVSRLGSSVSFYKVGLRLFTHYGPDVLRLLKKKRKKIFLDLKLHDIPNTVAEACREAVAHRVDMLTVHTLGGFAMMQAAAQAAAEAARLKKIPKPWIMGVTVLTSMNSLGEIGIQKAPAAQVLALASLAQRSGLDGVISSPQEIQALRRKFKNRLKIVTPGIRPAGSAANDQKRVMTPAEAFRLGADAIVVGRPILQAKDPLQVVEGILKDSKK